MTAVFGITAAALAALALGFILARRIPGWQGPGHHTPAAVEHARDDAWTAELDTMTMRTARPAVDRVREGSADLDQFLPPWGQATAPDVTHLCPPIGEYFTPCCRQNPYDLPRTDRMTLDESLVTCLEAYLDPLPEPEYLTAPTATHAPPDVAPGRVHAGCEISDTGQQAALTALEIARSPGDELACRDGMERDDEPHRWCWRVLSHEPPHRDAFGREWTESDQAICLCGKVPDIPGEPITEEWDCPAHAHLWDGNCGCPECCTPAPAFRDRLGPAPDDTVTDMRPVPAPVAARENAAARFSLQGYVRVTLARKPPLRAWVDDVIGTSPAEDWDRLLEKARAGAVSDGG